ncbi:DUF2971 domain-containing protein [Pseudomonas viridiflava]|uniref:DUF2971 domain-containing protein n=1 Tax=Pseudomonas viridiflava TaxID=33069 RepID=UPI000F06AD11|nr:DUF2971 domain-containing protein [Pseudomonas viridiflava]
MSEVAPKMFYRFRPINRLLGQAATPEKMDENGRVIEAGKPAIPGELEESYIFFPSPEALNDPFEGYTKFFWSGDKIAWANLFRHYVHSLGCKELARLLGAEQRPIPVALSRAAGKWRKIYEEVFAIVISDDRVLAHIEELAARERKVTRHELLTQILVLNDFITDRLFFIFAKYKIVPEYKALWRGKHSELSSALLAAQKHANATNVELSRIESNFIQLGGLFQASKFALEIAKHLSGAGGEVFTDFPTLYVDQLPTLTQDPWYVACFMSNCTNSSIWASYGDNHKGACLIFDTIPNKYEESCLMLEVPTNDGSIGYRPWRAKLHKVDYNNTPVEINFFENLAHMTRSELDFNWLTDREGGVSPVARGYGSTTTRDRYWSDIDRRLTRKWKDWSSESEYRIIYNPGARIVTDPNYRKLTYNFSALKGICFGAKTDFSDIVKLVELIMKLCEKHNRTEFDFYQAYHHSGTNNLVLNKLGTFAQIKEKVNRLNF